MELGGAVLGCKLVELGRGYWGVELGGAVLGYRCVELGGRYWGVKLGEGYRDAGWWCWLGWEELGCRWVELDGEASGKWGRKDFGMWVGGYRQRTCLELRGHWVLGGKSRVDEVDM